MFTGLVETLGTIETARGTAPRRLVIGSSLPSDEIELGDSVAVDGCCLTVVAKASGSLTFEAATETLARTTIGRLAVGQKVNLERALRVGDRLGGHWVLGHVDGVGRVTAREQRGSALYLRTEVEASLARFIAAQGSVTLAGVSLTVTSVAGATFEVGLIPHTLAVTTLGEARLGSELNVEVDVVARYLARLVETGERGPSLTVQDLKDKGFS